MAGQVRLELLGGLRVTRDGVPVRGFVSGKAAALLAYLAVTGRAHTREALAGLLWGELRDEDARLSLRQVPHNLRGLLGDQLAITRATIGWNPAAPCWLDVAAFLGGSARRRPRRTWRGCARPSTSTRGTS